MVILLSFEEERISSCAKMNVDVMDKKESSSSFFICLIYFSNIIKLLLESKRLDVLKAKRCYLSKFIA